MSISKYNGEGYFDPTAYEALNSIKKQETKKLKSSCRPLVYICSPFAGDTEHNTYKARRYSRFAVSKKAIPLAPHLLFPQFLNDKDKEQRKLGILMGLVLLGKCKELWCFGSKITRGMEIELEKARKWNITIRYFTNSCKEVLKNV